MRVFKLCSGLFLAALVGCSTIPMDVVSDQKIQQPAANQSQVVFIRTNLISGIVAASLYEVRGDKTEFIGLLQDETKIALKTTPGEHLYMVVSESADFLQANLAPGKTHYVIVTPRLGWTKARFSMYPISTDPSAEYTIESEDFQEWLDETALVTLSERALAWYQQNKASVEEKRLEYWPDWQEQSAEDKLEHTLQPSDGL